MQVSFLKLAKCKIKCWFNHSVATHFCHISYGLNFPPIFIMLCFSGRKSHFKCNGTARKFIDVISVSTTHIKEIYELWYFMNLENNTVTLSCIGSRQKKISFQNIFTYGKGRLNCITIKTSYWILSIQS